VPYLISVLVAAAGVVVLLTLLMRLAGPARRLAGTVYLNREHLADRTGLLAARIAALRVQLDRRRRRNWRSAPTQRRPRSIEPAPEAREETHNGHFVRIGEPRRHNDTIR
jgi:hypothetical protein